MDDIFGKHFSDGDVLVHALVDLYGLLLLQPKLRHYYITMPTAHKVENPGDLPKEVMRLILAALNQQVTGLTKSFSESAPGYHPSGAHSPVLKGLAKMKDGVENEAIRFRAAAKARSAGYYPAVRRLLVLAEPAVPTPVSAPVPFANVDAEAQRLDALMMFSLCHEAILDCARGPLPVCVFEPSRLAFTLRCPVGVSRPDFKYGFIDDSGVFHEEGRFMNVVAH